LKNGRAQEILRHDEFDKQLHVIELPPEPPANASGLYVLLPGPDPVPEAFPLMKTTNAARRDKSMGKKMEQAITGVPTQQEPWIPPPPETSTKVHEPTLEDGEGFDGRRPAVDPFQVGEKLTLEVSYFGVSGGEMVLEVRPFVRVNGRKSYHLVGTAKSNSVFSMFYAVDDWFETFIDYQTLVPSSYALHVKESKQLRETRCLFDWTKMQATFWDKRIDVEQKVEERKFEWAIPMYSQNIFTAAHYLRNFQLKPGKTLAFVVAHEKENLTITGEVLRREKLQTPIGELNTVVLKPKIELNGVFKPVGDVFVWLTDDDRKYIVRIESKIKIGTVVASLVNIQPGRAPAAEE
jgi:hypothetical protein